MTASGSFDVKLDPQKDETAPAGRMIINKQYSGGLAGEGVGQMLSKRTESGVAVYAAIEEFSGTVDGKKGAFTLIHNGYMTSESQTLKIEIIEGSGSGELKNISGELSITQVDGTHNYELYYKL